MFAEHTKQKTRMSGSTFGATRFGDYVEKHGPKQTLVIGARRAADEPFSAPPSAIVFEEVTMDVCLLVDCWMWSVCCLRVCWFVESVLFVCVWFVVCVCLC
jgi:hypothetical protein